ncbi:MAG: AsnC family transcriptional regulator [Oligoflexia bacterium]|nr:AsnC family transcriptional regulator [Oligoflexia bacterium]
MRYNSKDGAILASAELRAREPISVLRHDTHFREHSIRYSLRRLSQRGVITQIPVINLQRIGITIVNVFFSVGAQKPNTQEALVRAFSDADQIVWIGEFGGEYQYGIALCSRRIGESLDFISELSKRFTNVFFEKAISYQYSVWLFPHKYLATKPVGPKHLRVGYTKDTVAIDEVDDRILRALASNGDISFRQLAQKIGMPASSVDMRLRRLQERKVIEGYVHAVNPAALGVQAFKLLVYAKGMNHELSAALMRYCEHHSRIVYFIECLGTWDYEIGVEVERAEDITGIIQGLYERFGSSINSVKLLSKFRDLKIRYYFGADVGREA